MWRILIPNTTKQTKCDVYWSLIQPNKQSVTYIDHLYLNRHDAKPNQNSISIRSGSPFLGFCSRRTMRELQVNDEQWFQFILLRFSNLHDPVYISRSTRQPALWTLRKASTRISLSMPCRLNRTDTVRILWIFCLRNHSSIPLSPWDGIGRPGLACANCAGWSGSIHYAESIMFVF